MKLTFAVIYERTPNNYSAYAPDLPGCAAVGATQEEVRENLRAAAAFHIEGIQRDGDPIPKPRLSVREAMDFHAAALAEAGQPPPPPETKAALVDVEVDLWDGAPPVRWRNWGVVRLEDMEEALRGALSAKEQWEVIVLTSVELTPFRHSLVGGNFVPHTLREREPTPIP